MFQKLSSKVKDVVSSKSFRLFLYIVGPIVLFALVLWFLFVRYASYKNITTLYNNGEYQKVITISSIYLRVHDDQKVALLLARAYVSQGKLVGEPETYLAKAIGILDTLQNSAEVLGTKGALYMLTGNISAAELAYKEARKLDPKNYTYVLNLAIISETKNDFINAYRLYNDTLRLRSSAYEASIGLLRVRMGLGKHDGVLSQAVSLVGRVHNKNLETSLYEIIGIEYAREKKFDYAEIYFRKVLENDPLRKASLVGLADILVGNLWKKIAHDKTNFEELLKEPQGLCNQALSIDKSYVYTYLVLLDVSSIKNDKDNITLYKNKINELLRSELLSDIERSVIMERIKGSEKLNGLISK